MKNQRERVITQKINHFLDQTKQNIIKKLSIKFKEEILRLFNYCFDKELLFSEWKESLTVFIDKLNKNKVRPISMTSCVGKILEKMVNERPAWWAENSNKFDLNQNTSNKFRKGKSCVDNIVKFIASIELSMLKKKYAFGLPRCIVSL